MIAFAKALCNLACDYYYYQYYNNVKAKEGQ